VSDNESEISQLPVITVTVKSSRVCAGPQTVFLHMLGRAGGERVRWALTPVLARQTAELLWLWADEADGDALNGISS